MKKPLAIAQDEARDAGKKRITTATLDIDHQDTQCEIGHRDGVLISVKTLHGRIDVIDRLSPRARERAEIAARRHYYRRTK